MNWSPCLIRHVGPGDRVEVRLGHEVVDDYLEFLAANPVPRGLSTRRSRDRGRRGEPLIRTPRTLPRVAEPAEYDQRMLGNGYCNRPAQLDCQFESICETCAYYTTDTTFDPVLQAQRDHAAERHQQHRVDLFQMLIDRNHKEAS